MLCLIAFAWNCQFLSHFYLVIFVQPLMSWNILPYYSSFSSLRPSLPPFLLLLPFVLWERCFACLQFFRPSTDFLVKLQCKLDIVAFLSFYQILAFDFSLTLKMTSSFSYVCCSVCKTMGVMVPWWWMVRYKCMWWQWQTWFFHDNKYEAILFPFCL